MQIFRYILAMGFVFSQGALAKVDFHSDLKEKITNERKLLLEAELKRRGVLGTLYEINKEVNRLAGDIRSVEDQLNAASRSAESYAKVIVNLETIRDRQKVLLRTRLRAMYKLGLQGYAEVLLSSETSQAFARNMKFFALIAQKDSELIKNYKANLDELNRQQTRFRKQVALYGKFKKDLTEQQEKYAAQKQEQLYLLNQIEKDRSSHLQAIKEWREAGRQLDDKLNTLGYTGKPSNDVVEGAFFEERGALKAPVSASISQKYGMVVNKRFNTKLFHKGLFFASQIGEKVVSIFSGKVAFSGWINGYGETIILDHGDHYYSLYAHNSKLEKKAGEKVTSGELIALAGDTGSLRGPGLYLEIRHFSESIDPLPWLDLPKLSRLR